MSTVNLPADVATILLLRTDAIGDNVLFSAFLEPLRAACPNARIVYACQDRVADLVRACPLVNDVLAFDRGRAYADEGYRQEIIARLAAIDAAVVINPMLTREPLADALVGKSRAAIRIGFSAQTLAAGCSDEAHTHRIVARTGPHLELERAGEMLDALGIAHAALTPRVWLTDADRQFAIDLFDQQQLDPQNTVILFAGALADFRINQNIARGLALARPGVTVISVGAAHEFALHRRLLEQSGLVHVNLCGLTTLRETAAVLEKTHLALGAETGAAHLAAAVGTPHAVILGGGHFGRFMPWSPLTTAAVLPMACFQCDWKCRHARAHCVQDISADTIATAIETALTPSAKPRLIIQETSPIAPADVASFIDPTTVEIIAASPRTRLATQRLATKSATAPHLFSVTAIVSTYKSERFLKGCLQDLVEQTLFARGQLEILVIDSASPENEAAIVHEFQQHLGDDRIRYIRTAERETLYAAWNRGVSLARGKYLTNANTDDRHHPEMLALLAATLDQHPEHALAYADSEVTQDANAPWTTARRTKTLTWPEFSRDRLFAGSFTGPHPMWRKSIHSEIGYFEAAMTSAGDYEFFLRLALTHTFIHVPQALGLYLENFQSISLANGGLTWYESRVARERYWNPAWGPNPGARHVAAAFDGLRQRAAALPAETRFALFGAGQHTERHLAEFHAALRTAGKIVAILDDRAPLESARLLGDVPVINSERWREFDLHAIVISSDTYEQALAGRAAELLGRSKLPILTVYKPELARRPAPAAMLGTPV